MTDDRAERIRKTRERFRPNGGDETEEPTDDASADTERESESSEEAETESQSDETESQSDEASTRDGGEADDQADDGEEYPSLDDVTEGSEDDEEYPSLDDVMEDDGEEYPSLDDLTDDGEADDTLEGGSSGDTEVTYNEADATTEADAGQETMNVPEIDAGSDAGTDGEPTVDASAIATEDDAYDQTVVSDDRDSFVDNDALARSAHRDEDTIQVLEFFLNDDRYAVEIEQISAIVEMKDITRFPRGPDAIDGVTDLRGEITAILDPTSMLDVERSEASEEHYIVVLKRSDDKQKLGIRVSDVSQAVTYHESQIDETASAMSDGGVADGSNVGEAGGVSDRGGDHEFVRGIIKKTENGDTSLVAWLDVDEVVGQIE